MLSKRALAFVALSLTATIVACSNLGMTQGVNVGPNFPSKTLYATNTNQNAISIYSNGIKSGSGPSYNIGGSNTGLNGPQYLAFDRAKDLWVTNYNESTKNAVIVEFAPLATGNVLPLNSGALPGRPRGIAFSPKGPSPKPSSSVPPPADIMVIAANIPTNVYPSQLLLYIAGGTAPYQSIAGPHPGLNLPGGVAIDKSGHVYVANLQGASVSQFVLPSPSPTPTPLNLYPRFTITSKNQLITPASVALDSSGNIYIIDQGLQNASCHSKQAPAIYVFPPYNKKIPYTKPTRTVQGCKTLLNKPTDLKVNSAGLVYVADSTRAGAGIIYVFAAGASGGVQNVAPTTNFTSPGAVTGLGLVP
jgi:hypothetical protein